VLRLQRLCGNSAVFTVLLLVWDRASWAAWMMSASWLHLDRQGVDAALLVVLGA
jgi:hypothetical protein